MANVTYRLPKNLHEKIKQHPEIRWGEIVRQAFTKKIEELRAPSRVSLKELEQSLTKEYKVFNEDEEIDLTLKSMELGRIRTKDLEKLIQESAPRE